TTATSWPCATRAFGSASTTSARPPVFENGSPSGATNKILTVRSPTAYMEQRSHSTPPEHRRRSRSLPGQRRVPPRHFVYNEVGSVKANFSVHFFWSVFSSPIRIFFFLAAKVRAVIVWRNFLSSTTHLFVPNPRPVLDYFFELANLYE